MQNHNHKMKVFLDLDGVITDFMSAACAVHNRPNPYLENSQHKGIFEMEKVWGITLEEFWEPIDKDGGYFWSNLKFMPDALNLLHQVEKIAGQENIYILTSPSNHYICSASKHDWIATHLPQYRRQFFIGSAKYFFAGENAILIDDYDKNVNSFREHGGKAILVPRMWNSNYNILHTVDSSVDFVANTLYLILSQFEKKERKG